MGDSRVCHACGRSNPDDARFCSGCGTSLAVEAPQREARKVVTALFADVVGSTVLGERLDPEDFQATVGEGVARAVRATEALGGHVERVAGDGALVLFGAPVAHEDDAERAVLAGLRVLEAMDIYSRELVEERDLEGFAVRVGVETGLAVLAAVGGARPIEFGAMGDVLNTAARLEAAAEPGSMLVGPHTFDLVEHAFEWGEPVELTLKGKAGTVVAHRPRGQRAGGGRRSQPARTRLVGRERELEDARRALDELLSGAGGVLLVTGEAGLGKTRLLAELRRRLERSSSAGGDPVWLEGRCVSYGEALPYFPFQVLLREWLGVTPEHPDAELAALLDERLLELFGDRGADLRPFLASVLGLAPGAEDAAVMARLQPEDLQLRVFRAVGELVQRLAADGPVLLAVDDMHWADSASVALLVELLDLTDEAPLLLVLAGRPEPEHASWRLREDSLRDHAHRTRAVELTALAQEADRELLAELAGGAGLPAELEQLVLERAEGNPLYLEELVRSLVDTGALLRDGDQWSFDRDVDVQVPETVEKLVLARVDVLSPDARELLCAASVLGRRFTRNLLADVVEGGDLDEGLRELRHADLVREGLRWPEQEYRFRHHLIQETTYGSVLRRRRQELHLRAAEAIERAFADRIDERLGVLAYHWRHAGELERAFDYHARAGAAAWRIVAAKEAIEQYTAAIEAATELGIGGARLRDVRFERAKILFFSGDQEAGGSEIKGVLEEARQEGDRSVEIEALTYLTLARYGGYRNAVALGERAVAVAREIADDAAEVRALSRLTILDANRLRLDRALSEGREALAIARRHDDEEITGLALDGLKLAELKLGELDEVERHCAELVDIDRRRDDAFYLAFALLESAQAPLARGDLERALAFADEALEINRKIGDRANEALFLDTHACIQRARGDHDRAVELARLAREAAAEFGTPEWEGWCSATLGWLLLELGEPAEAASVLETGAEAARASEAAGEVLRCTAHLAWAAWLLEERERALALADEAEAMMREITVPPGGAWLFGSHAQLAVARVRLESGDGEAAAAIARPLADAAERVGWHEAFAAAAALLGGNADSVPGPRPRL
ncbi:MAG: AAA family ATPase [Thermoleophilaceae bacterium]